VVTNAYAFYLCIRGCGRVGRPAFPTPFGVENFWHNPGAMRRGIAESRLMNTDAPHYRSSSPATGSRECAPDDRLRRAIQYSEASMIEPKSCGVLDPPHARGTTVYSGAASCIGAMSSLA
jgi:hypothetical protein